VKCSRIDCVEDARWRPILLLRPKPAAGGDPPPPARVVVGVGVCDAHKRDVPELYITDDGWKHLLGGFDRAGKQRPHRSSTTVEYVDLDDPRAGAFTRDFDA
jgi:hypothetical protein